MFLGEKNSIELIFSPSTSIIWASVLKKSPPLPTLLPSLRPHKPRNCKGFVSRNFLPKYLRASKFVEFLVIIPKNNKILVFIASFPFRLFIQVLSEKPHFQIRNLNFLLYRVLHIRLTKKLYKQNI